MTSNPFDSLPTSRRRFVLDVVGGLAGGALVAGCGSAELARTANTGGDGGNGAAPPENGGAPPDASNSTGTGGSSNGGAVNGGAGGAVNGGAGGAAGASATGGAINDAGTCALYPQQTEGPFYLDLNLLRSDITEGKPGAPLELELTVIRASGCTPIAKAVVDVWQCDMEGVYAGFAGQLGGLDTTGQKFLRGTQITGADGKVVFQTIYPGWYPGRTTHIHFKVHLTANLQMTSQMYFPEDITAAVYQLTPYAARGQKDTSNLADAIAQTGGMPPVLAVAQNGAGFKATLVISALG